MATFEITEGAPGQGKSLYTAKKALDILKRNKKWHEKQKKEWEGKHSAWESTMLRVQKTMPQDKWAQWHENNPEPILPPHREIWSNLKFSEQFEKEWDGFIKYWVDSTVLITLHDVDIIWDEIATELDSRNFANLSIEMKRFLSQYRKRGIDIYANTQDFSMIDARARLMISGVRTLTKIMGSRDISTTKPKPKHIWGIVVIREVENYRETDPEKKKYSILFDLLFIDKEKIDIYDTRQDIPLGEAAPLKHIVRHCEYFGMLGHKCENHQVIQHM
jgi:hypothetical protein